MDTFDEDMFADDDIQILSPQCNPVEEHLIKQLSDVQNRIEKTNNDINEMRNTTKHILKSLDSKAQYGEVITSDSDSDLYTVEGHPVVKRKMYKRQRHSQILVVKHTWQRVFCDKWIIGITLHNTSMETICDPRLYVDIKEENEFQGISTLWYLMDEVFWHKTDMISPRKKVVATIVLDVPKFDRQFSYEAFGTVMYEIDEKEYQTPVPTVRLSVEDTIDNSCGLKFSNVNTQHLLDNVLALKSVSVEKNVGIRHEGNYKNGEKIFDFLAETSFKEISEDVYIVKASGMLQHCLVEILPVVKGEARLRISARSSSQMNVILLLLRDRFPDLSIKEQNSYNGAAMVLLQELELYLHHGSASEKQRAKIKSDLLIP